MLKSSTFTERSACKGASPLPLLIFFTFSAYSPLFHGVRTLFELFLFFRLFGIESKLLSHIKGPLAEWCPFTFSCCLFLFPALHLFSLVSYGVILCVNVNKMQTTRISFPNTHKKNHDKLKPKHVRISYRIQAYTKKPQLHFVLWIIQMKYSQCRAID